MLYKECFNCWKLISYALHLITGIKCCTATVVRSPTQHQLHQIEMSLDQSVDPCEDFYAYACNNWAEHHTVPRYDEITGQVDYQMNVKLINIIESAYQYPFQVNDQCQTFVEKTRIYYKACLREEGRNVTRYFEHIKPGPGLEWPLLKELQSSARGRGKDTAHQEWPNGQFNIFALLGELQSFGLNNVLISQEMAQTQNGSLQIMLELPYISKGDIIPPPALMVLLTVWGFSEEIALRWAKQIKMTEERWLNIYQNYTNSNDNHPVKLNYGELKASHPQLSTFLEHIVPGQLQDDDFVALQNMDYFEFLLNKPWAGNETRNICNYLMLKMLMHLIKDTANDFTKLDCIKDLRNKMDLSINYLYYEHIYRPQAWQYNQRIDTLIKNIYKYYLDTLAENHLNLNGEQLQQLQEKLSSIKVNLGNLPRHFDMKDIDQFYGDVPALDPKDYYGNHLHLLRHRFRKSLLYPQNQTFFIASDGRVGSSSAPIYIPKQHMVILPMGFLQPPIYHCEYHPIFEWSMLGFLLAHEYTHAIDITGLEYGNDGLPAARDTGILDNDNFSASLECMLEQEPTEAIDERLSDLVGVRVAFKAYINEHNWQLQPKFSSISWKQLFFLNLAQFFCGRKNVQFVDHDTDAVRLRQIVMNMNSFAEAFQCPIDSQMNPKKKCRLY